MLIKDIPDLEKSYCETFDCFNVNITVSKSGPGIIGRVIGDVAKPILTMKDGSLRRGPLYVAKKALYQKANHKVDFEIIGKFKTIEEGKEALLNSTATNMLIIKCIDHE